MSARQPLLTLLAIGIFGCQVGCVSFGDLFSKDQDALDVSLLAQQGIAIPPGGMPTKTAPDPMPGVPSIVLEVRSDSRHLERIPLPADRALFIEDLVAQAQLAKRLGRTNISIMRSTGPDTPPVRMDIEVNSKGKASNLGSNYALRSGDHVLVNPNDKSAFDEFLQKRLGVGR